MSEKPTGVSTYRVRSSKHEQREEDDGIKNDKGV